MRIDFNILWVEDQPDAVSAQRKRIGHLLRKEGFRTNEVVATSVADARQHLADDVFGDHIDLVLMDYDLGDGPDGIKGIEIVRDAFPFKDIVFYSASGVGKLRDALSSSHFQGVFYSLRQDLPDTVFGVFQSLTKKVLDIDHARGIVMGATSEIDHLVNQLIIIAYSKSTVGLKEHALKLMREQIGENRKSFEKEAKKVEGLQDLALLSEMHQAFTSAHRLRLLRKMLESAGSHEAEREAMKVYANNTIPRRNDLAHVQVEKKGFARKLTDRKGNEVTAEDMRELRIALLDHFELLERLYEGLDQSGVTAVQVGPH